MADVCRTGHPDWLARPRHSRGFFAAIALLACALAGCTGPRKVTEPTAPSGCPESLRDGIRVMASVAQVAIPDGVRMPSGAVGLAAGVGRRVLLAIDVPPGMPRTRLLSSSVEMLTFGGTLAGWARVVEPATAIGHQSIQVSAGLLRIAPFFPQRRLGPYTETVDVVVDPGGAPAAGLALHPGRMWDDSGRPIAPHDLTIVLVPILHLKVLDVVSGTVQLDFTALRRSAPHERWQCSIESDFQLVDHLSALPRLWVLRPAARTGGKDLALALYDPSIGVFPAVFLDPATAAGFARWLSETHAKRVSQYQIGLTQEASATGFQAVSSDGFGELIVRQLGER